jgi:hypothetical protein
MRQSAPDLITLCASIMSDGEISADEAYNLAAWLNEHPEAATTWPGSELIKPLQEIWADGSANRRDLHRLARLLISVQREWAARHPRGGISTIDGESASAFTLGDLNDARLPSVSAKFRVPSQSDSGTIYEVDLAGPSCTCPDWRTWRSHLPVGDLTRCCKHVLDVYAQIVRQESTGGCLMAFIENGWPPHPGAEWHLATIGDDTVLFCTASAKGWANVFAKDGESYARFGYNVEEDRWAYGLLPVGGEQIAATIISFQHKPARREIGETSLPDRVELSRPKILVTALWISAAIVAVLACFAVMIQRPASNTQVNNAVMGSPALSPAVQSPTATPVYGNSSVTQSTATQDLSLTKPASNAFLSRVKTIHAIRAETGRGEILIPSKTELRVLGRNGPNLSVSYNGWTVTIPASAVAPTSR